MGSIETEELVAVAMNIIRHRYKNYSVGGFADECISILLEMMDDGQLNRVCKVFKGEDVN